MTWIDVDAEKVRQAASTLRETKTEVQAVADYAHEADPDWWMWGLAGIPFAALYFAATEMVFHPALEDAQEAIEGLCVRLEDCADDHEASDAEVAQELEKLGEELTGGN
ncbi:type VII secretion target [Glycomyces buryatensis]|uniref:Uncharacterized protein n=1 Tax=Glycomyces buryatensis TaxID=2570927 RepID=A0A4S8PSW1_9ACTN|nr:type VII secretion target [Glycomyces buryatensis]THV34378.1 hypothetical protein FAB82_24295 [Glycomyces buryatensis]